MNNKIKPNRYKPVTAEVSHFNSDFNAGIDVCLKFIMVVAFFCILSLAAIYVHDFITQAEFFNITEIEILGTDHVTREEILALAGLNRDRNIYEVNASLAERQILSHPWVQSADLDRRLGSKLKIVIKEHEPLAIVRIREAADILINIQGLPFKEYDPLTDHAENLPIITGLDLTPVRDQYGFSGRLFDSVMDFLKTAEAAPFERIQGNELTGIILETKHGFNSVSTQDPDIIPIKLGFDNFNAKLKKAKKIKEYIDKHLPEKTICAMDIFNIEKVFIKTKLNDALHNNLKKGA
ncbi:MAG: FtsQ-type POTRA domain-containing protein [Desulfobacula sp.]|nr:FtsQ-type POTRA domain-containing protein [Desulfobacula sp.]